MLTKDSNVMKKTHDGYVWNGNSQYAKIIRETKDGFEVEICSNWSLSGETENVFLSNSEVSIKVSLTSPFTQELLEWNRLTKEDKRKLRREEGFRKIFNNTIVLFFVFFIPVLLFADPSREIYFITGWFYIAMIVYVSMNRKRFFKY